MKQTLEYARPMPPQESRYSAAAIISLILAVVGCPCLMTILAAPFEARPKPSDDVERAAILITPPGIGLLLAVFAVGRIRDSGGRLKGKGCAELAAILCMFWLPLALILWFLTGLSVGP